MNKKGEVVHILDNKYESQLTILTCFFSAAKYEEIYPPALNDFLFTGSSEKEKVERKAVIAREVDIIELT